MTIAASQGTAISAGAQVAQGAPAKQEARAVVGAWELTFTIGAMLGESIAVLVATSDNIPFGVALLVHLIVIAVMSFVLFRRRRTGADLTSPMLTLIFVSAAGPVGALIGLIGLLGLMRPVTSSALLKAWYTRLAFANDVDAQTLIADRVASGRMLEAGAPSPEALVAVIQRGTMEQRQATLGLIARAFHPNYLAALAVALRSEEPVIRVQAAAVATRIRPRLAADVIDLIARAGSIVPDAGMTTSAVSLAERLDTIRRLGAAIDCHLLDAPLEGAARATLQRLVGGVDCFAVPVSRSRGLEDLARDRALEAHLIASGSFNRLRILRSRKRLARRGDFRIRRRPKAAWPVCREGRSAS